MLRPRADGACSPFPPALLMDSTTPPSGKPSSGPRPSGPRQPRPKYAKPFSPPVIVMMILVALAVVTLVAREQAQAPATISYDEFVRQVEAENVSAVEITANTLLG